MKDTFIHPILDRRALSHRWVAQWRASFGPVFLRWWRRSLLECLPAHWVESFTAAKPERLWFWRDGELFTDDGVIVAGDSSAVCADASVVVLPRAAVLFVSVRLPKAALHDLTAILAFEMDKLTPFKASDVYFATTSSMSSKIATLDVELIVIPRIRLDQLLLSWSRHGLSFKRIDVLDDFGLPLEIDLSPRSESTITVSKRWTVRGVLASLSVILVLAAMLLWVNNREHALNDMRAEVKALRTEALNVQALRQKLNAAQEAGQYVLARKLSTPMLSAVLSSLSQCVPTNTWLEQLEIDPHGQLSLAGQSSDAGGLLNALKACTDIVNWQFQGVIQRDANTGKERFSLSAQLRSRDGDHAQ